MMDVDVLIVGGGLVGLSAALFLAEHLEQGGRVLVVEKHAGTSIHPRARGFNERTIEHFRATRAGTVIEREGGIPEEVPIGGILTAVTLADAPLAWQPRVPQARTTGLSPCPPVFMGQDRLERILLHAVTEEGVVVRFSTEMTHFEQDGDGVTANIVDRTAQRHETVRARYMVAADGVRSSVREALGIRQRGRGTLGHNVSAVFEADLTEVRRERPFGFAIVTHPEAAGIFVSAGSKDRWLYGTEMPPDGGALSTKDFVQRIRQAAGLPTLAVNVLGAFAWETGERVAERFSHGRVFLAGDAAHQMTPAGGFGANTGIQDAANLAWKLALVLQGRARPALLDSFDTERRPVATATAEQATILAYRMAAQGGRPAHPLAAQEPVDSDCVVFGYRYGVGDSPLPRTLVLDGTPGSRAPHAGLDIDGVPTSTIDLLGRTFVLFAGDTAWKNAADALGLPLRTHVLSGWQSAYGVKEEGAVLVRPDGVIAARFTQMESDAERALVRAFDIFYVLRSG
ncbi:FAD-dependent oxidoreductase [Pendulispora rubella]|uniref:FAD-dependent oxidoreductase n=1 Tax=Pendulispora rubella TaxID=2741070 RepID=A0ABZ2LJH8_9BACT